LYVVVFFNYFHDDTSKLLSGIRLSSHKTRRFLLGLRLFKPQDEENYFRDWVQIIKPQDEEKITS